MANAFQIWKIRFRYIISAGCPVPVKSLYPVTPRTLNPMYVKRVHVSADPQAFTREKGLFLRWCNRINNKININKPVVIRDKAAVPVAVPEPKENILAIVAFVLIRYSGYLCQAYGFRPELVRFRLNIVSASGEKASTISNESEQACKTSCILYPCRQRFCCPELSGREDRKRKRSR